MNFGEVNLQGHRAGLGWTENGSGGRWRKTSTKWLRFFKNTLFPKFGDKDFVFKLEFHTLLIFLIHLWLTENQYAFLYKTRRCVLS